MMRLLASPNTRFLAILGLTATSFFFGTRLFAQESESATQEKDVAAAVTKSPPANSPMAFINEGGVPTSIEQLRMMEEAVAEISAEAKLATVNIELQSAQGSGVVVTSDGYILTAAHVIGRPNRIANITFPDGKKVKALTLGVNDSYDSGMLKIIEDGTWPYLDIGESETLNRGQWVMALGHPGGLKKDRGIVVRIGRLLTTVTGTLRTDCTLVGGDSGGPLIDFDGNVIGIHSRIGGRLSENMHVSIDVFSEEWDDLAVGDKRPKVGISLSRRSNKISRIAKGEPAEKAGLEKDDVILKFNGKDISNRDEFVAALKDVKAEDEVEVVVERDDEELEFTITLGYHYRRPAGLEKASDDDK